MNDLDLLVQLGDETPLPDAASLAPVRARVVAELAAHRHRSCQHRPSRRMIVLTGSVVAAAAAVAAAVLVPATHATPHAGNGNVTAARLLDLAAAAALAQQPVIPKPDQYVYTKTTTGGVATETWNPVSYKPTGLMKQGNQSPTVISEERPAFYPGMPTSASAMPGFFTRTLGTDPADPSVVNYLPHLAVEILSDDYLLPAQRAALYKFLATVPGVSVVRDVRDADGRPGTGLAWSVQGAKWILIFDSRTFAYLGTNASEGGNSPWTVSLALLKTAIVNRPGQLP